MNCTTIEMRKKYFAYCQRCPEEILEELNVLTARVFLNSETAINEKIGQNREEENLKCFKVNAMYDCLMKWNISHHVN